MSRDEQNVLITSYAELKQCMDQSFGEILSSSAPTASTVAGASSSLISQVSPSPLQQSVTSATAVVTSAQAITMANNVAVSNNNLIINSTASSVATGS